MKLVDYKNGQKNHWRRYTWNRIADFIPDRKNCHVLYLPGSKDLDRNEAVRRGFSGAKCIAVERNTDIVKSLRSSGRTVIEGDLADVVHSWPKDRLLDVVVADLQCGFTDTARRVIEAWTLHPATRRSVLVLNMQRGRERTDEVEEWLRFAKNVKKPNITSDKSRAVFAIGYFWGVASEKANIVWDDKVAVGKFAGHLKDKVWQMEMPTYRSTPSSPLFDSFLITEDLPYESVTPAFPRSGEFEFNNVRRKVGAALAVSSMRNNGYLRHAS